MIRFPHNFFWGAATSAYQVEGNNVNSDWWEWEKRAGLKERSGQACRHYELYREDFDLARQLNHNAHRFSVEWSRIEPEEGKFSEEEIRHYGEVLFSLRERGLEPIVTLHHFTNPVWFARLDGWQNRKSTDYFLRYVSRVVEALGNQVHYWVTINEPIVYVYESYLLGLWPPQESSIFKAKRVIDNLILSHIKSYQRIKDIYKKKDWPLPSISIAQNMQAFNSCRDTLRNKIAVYLRNKYFNFYFIERLLRYQSLDFIGVNYYTRGLIDLDSWSIKAMAADNCKNNHDPLRKNTMGWDIYPQGLYELLLKLKRFNLPIFILENGICTQDDALRWEFIYEHLRNLSLAIIGGVEVLGYIYWSLIDNYEWDKGFGHRFGLIEVDYATYRRTIRESARRFSEICKTGILEI